MCSKTVNSKSVAARLRAELANAERVRAVRAKQDSRMEAFELEAFQLGYLTGAIETLARELEGGALVTRTSLTEHVERARKRAARERAVDEDLERALADAVEDLIGYPPHSSTPHDGGAS